MLRVLRQSLLDGGKIIAQLLGKARIRYKARQNLLTQADIRSQKVILRRIKHAFADHDYLAEEDAVKSTGAPYHWVIDPLDGTTNFAHAMPLCCVSIALLYHNTVIAGGIYDPFHKELFLAERGNGATCNGKRIHVSKVPHIQEALLMTGFPYDRGDRADYYLSFVSEFMKKAHGIRRSGSAALDLAWVACGRLDAFWEFQLHPWDVAAGRILIEEAGGKVSDFEGRPWTTLKTFGQQTLATNGHIHAPVLRILRRLIRKHQA